MPWRGAAPATTLPVGCGVSRAKGGPSSSPSRPHSPYLGLWRPLPRWPPACSQLTQASPLGLFSRRVKHWCAPEGRLGATKGQLFAGHADGTRL